MAASQPTGLPAKYILWKGANTGLPSPFKVYDRKAHHYEMLLKPSPKTSRGAEVDASLLTLLFLKEWRASPSVNSAMESASGRSCLLVNKSRMAPLKSSSPNCKMKQLAKLLFSSYGLGYQS